MPVERTDVDVEAFLALARARSAPRTVEAYGRDLAHFAAWLDRPCAEATTEEIELYVAELRAAGRSPATVARRLAALRGFFRQYELYYVVADERDVVRLRTNYRGERVFLYRLRGSPELARRLLVSYLEQINRLATLQVTDQGPVPLSAFPGPVIDAHDPGRWGIRQLMATNQAQNGIAAPIEALFAAYLGSGLSSGCQSKLTEGFLQLDGALSMRAAKLWEPFCENLLWAGALGAEKATHVQNETDRTPTGWKVMQSACIATLHPRGERSTTRA